MSLAGSVLAIDGVMVMGERSRALRAMVFFFFVCFKSFALFGCFFCFLI